MFNTQAFLQFNKSARSFYTALDRGFERSQTIHVGHRVVNLMFDGNYVRVAAFDTKSQLKLSGQAPVTIDKPARATAAQLLHRTLFTGD